MKDYIKPTLLIIFSISLFMFGWLSHSMYTPKLKLSEEIPIEIVRVIETPMLKKPSLLKQIKEKKVLHVILLNSLSTYYIGSDGKQGFEYDLLKSYADSLGVKLKITTVQTTKEAIELSKTIKPDITSASFAKTPLREKSFNFGPSYSEIQEQVVCYRGMQNSRFPRGIDDLAGLSLMIGEDTSYSETIQNLKDDSFDINATLTSKFSSEELLEKVASHEIDCTIVDSNIYAINLKYFPDISLAFTISEREQLAWLLADDEDLKRDIYSWLNNFNQSGSMAELKDHYYSHLLFFDYYNATVFYKRVKSRLPKYKKIFQDAGKDYGISWTLLASISYQESHWNPNAKSFTGVRGLMMLTNKTAKLLGVKNRLDPKESIVGGTRHIKQMIKFVPKGVVGENRLKFALAAYNIGLGHIHDAQSLARKLNLDAHSWNNLKKTLPLLSDKKHYKTLKYGYARGSEAVKYVEAIYNYKDMLEKTSQKIVENNNTTQIKEKNAKF